MYYYLIWALLFQNIFFFFSLRTCSFVIILTNHLIFHILISMYIKLRFCLYICPNHAKFWLHTFQGELWTKTPSTKFLYVCLSECQYIPCFSANSAHDSRKNGWRDYYEISYLDQKKFPQKTTQKKGGGSKNENSCP